MYVEMKPKTNPQTGTDYYVYVLLYADYLLRIHHDLEISMNRLKGV